MNMNILLAEDDIFFQEMFCEIIRSVDYRCRILIADNKQDALKIATDEFIDIFIIDIGLKESDGLDLGREIRKIREYFFTQMIVITIYDRLKLISYEDLRCFTFIDKNSDWILKLENALKYLITNIEPLEKQRVSITAADRTIIITNRKDILYFESKDHRVIISTNDGDFELKYITLSNLIKILGEGFIQCHRSYIINMDYISKISFKDRIIMIKQANTAIPIGRLYLEKTKKAFYRYLHNINTKLY